MKAPTEGADSVSVLDTALPVPTRSHPAPIAEDPHFMEFWDAYPRKVGKGQARRAWQTALRSGIAPQVILAAVRRFGSECQQCGTPKAYIPHPVTWLSGERYADEMQGSAAAAPRREPRGRMNGEQLVAAVVRLSADQDHPITAAGLIIDMVRSQSSPDAPAAVTVTAERGRELAGMPYQEYLLTPEWQQRRRIALAVADYRCQVCNRERPLHVHHRTYERRGTEMPGDLTVLCDECHALYHGKGLLAQESA